MPACLLFPTIIIICFWITIHFQDPRIDAKHPLSSLWLMALKNLREISYGNVELQLSFMHLIKIYFPQCSVVDDKI